jgi:alanine transaminase
MFGMLYIAWFVLFSSDVLCRAQFTKLATMSLCSNTVGQLAMALHLSPPKQGDPSYDLYVSEKNAVLDSLKRRAMKVSESLNKLEGMSCTLIQGAMYAFPRIRLPEKAVATSIAKGCPPDEFYVRELLEETGVVCVAGSGFLQVDGTFHFRTTILPPEDQIDEVIERVAKFHSLFMSKYR